MVKLEEFAKSDPIDRVHENEFDEQEAKSVLWLPCVEIRVERDRVPSPILWTRSRSQLDRVQKFWNRSQTRLDRFQNFWTRNRPGPGPQLGTRFSSFFDIF